MQEALQRHQSHDEIIKRLKRADGHLRRVITMIEEARPCVDIAQQLYAVEKAVCQAKRTLIHDHLDHCLEHRVEVIAEGEAASLDEFKQIARYL
ncbi:metal-sensing transcriptional repressor [Halomonas sp. GXIMD04776]|uniref:metal-sensing transcriptional repressor n=1 Tax=Halomonas sp. GXIMD04776 TaxID=3415605 RepID=UPI003CA92E4A